jgi:hypothetical protein
MKFILDVIPIALAATATYDLDHNNYCGCAVCMRRDEAWALIGAQENWLYEDGSELEETLYKIVLSVRANDRSGYGDGHCMSQGDEGLLDRLKRLLEPYRNLSAIPPEADEHQANAMLDALLSAE